MFAYLGIRHNSPLALLIRITLVQLTLTAVGFTILMLYGWHEALSYTAGAVICILGTFLLWLVAFRQIRPGYESIYIRIMGRVQLVRLFVSALLLALVIVWMDMNPVYVITGFILVLVLSWFAVFRLLAARHYHYYKRS